MARSLVQSLEGISFPCDRARLIEYARTNEAATKALDALDAIPARQYTSLAEVLSAVPSKSDARRRLSRPAAIEAEGHQADKEEDVGEEEEMEEEKAVAKAVDSPLEAWRSWIAASTEMWWRMWFPWLR